MRGRRLTRTGEEGSALLLVPAAVLVLVILAAISVDAAIVYAAQRQLAGKAAAAANDIAGMAVDDAAFYDGGAVALDPQVADDVLAVHLQPAAPPAGWVRIDGVADTAGRTVTVRTEGEVRLVFAAAIPGARRTATVRATATATAMG